MIKEKPKKIRVTLDLTPEFYQRLQGLADLIEVDSHADLIREALRLAEMVYSGVQQGDELQMVSSAGKTRTLVLLNVRRRNDDMGPARRRRAPRKGGAS